ncbi:2-oxo-4-hydroxy-4-carboxy-5-ureidoimidazoline decarboxylase [Nocardioides stalactiti]|uniref:2-oxo-4-hydroxy-4-carboxy-5-ureidoimidazoline decarboxylase n=1 Tax=Nocardioides stalactiti TaxID=2755356 RepID=UPI0016044C06|nr:2-oxo-4-hydroxy-4-carboxy-5-ureidoimidazoline decarboxylase [Nocardioides stalactiti]
MRIEDFNALPAAEAAALVRACADADAWVSAVVDGRPYPDARALVEAADALAEGWTEDDVDQALSHHPRIGERGEGSSAAASAREQAGVDPADHELAAALRAGNAAYEARFDRIYLVRAKGRTGPELLALLQERLTHDPETEYAVMVEQLRQIARLRMEDLVS